MDYLPAEEGARTIVLDEGIRNAMVLSIAAAKAGIGSEGWWKSIFPGERAG